MVAASLNCPKNRNTPRYWREVFDGGAAGKGGGGEDTLPRIYLQCLAARGCGGRRAFIRGCDQSGSTGLVGSVRAAVGRATSLLRGHPTFARMLAAPGCVLASWLRPFWLRHLVACALRQAFSSAPINACETESVELLYPFAFSAPGPFSSSFRIERGSLANLSAMPCSQVARSQSSMRWPAPMSITSLVSLVRSS